MTEEEVCELSDLNYREALREQSRRSGGVVVERDGVLLMAGGHEHATMNTAIRIDRNASPSDVLSAAKQFYGELGRGFGLALRTDGGDRDLEAAATADGMAALLSPPAMVLESRPTDKALPDGVDIRVVGDDRGVRDFGEVSSRAWSTYGLPAEVPMAIFARGESVLAPHIQGVVAYRNEQPEACALVLLSHGIAGIYWVGTIEEARGTGLGEAVTRTVSNLGFDAQARFVSLQASPMGRPIYARMGFREVFSYQVLLSM